MFCDMVGFTEISSRVDPEILQQIIRRYEDACAVCVTRYDGYVYQRLGDGIVAFFGYPLAHEGEAERAIHAGLAILESMRILEVPAVQRLQVRIGIASGVVVVAGAEKGAVGETMSLAARLQGLAAPGGIVISEPVRRLAGGAFDYLDLGRQALKGITHPQHLHQVQGVSKTASRFEAATSAGLTPLVGREHEIALFLERWQLAQDGEGQVVLLAGEPGIGKSRISSGLSERLQALGAKAWSLQCSPFHSNTALYPFIDALIRLVDIDPEESTDAKFNRLEAVLITQYGLPRADLRYFAGMLSLAGEERFEPITLTPQKRKDETLRVLVDFVFALAHRRSLVMMFEDAHWADRTSLEALDQLIERMSEVPLLLVLTHRPEFQARWTRFAHTTAWRLAKLTRAQSTAMVAKVTRGKALPAALLEQIVARTDGIPLFVEELTRAVLESGQLTDTGDRFEYAGDAPTIVVPVTLRDSLTARLDRAPKVKAIAQIGAAIGREFSYELIAAVAATPRAELDRALEQFTDSGLAFRRGAPPDATYVFKHALVQDAAYESLLKSTRRELHTVIGETLEVRFPQTVSAEPELLARHFTQAGVAEKAARYWLAAGRSALKTHALPETVAHLEQGLQQVESRTEPAELDSLELDLRAALGMAWFALKGWGSAEARETLTAAMPLAKRLKRSSALSLIYYGLWSDVITSGRLIDSLALGEEVLRLGEETEDSSLRVVAHNILCVTHYWLGNFVSALSHARRLRGNYRDELHRELVDTMNIDPASMSAVYEASCLWALGFPAQALQMTETTVARARRFNHPFDLGYVLSWGQHVLDLVGDHAKAFARVEEAERLGEEFKLFAISPFLSQVSKGCALIGLDENAEGISTLQRALDIWDSMGCQVATPPWKTLLALGHARLGDTDDALNLINVVLDDVARPDRSERAYLAETLRVQGWVHECRGEDAKALAAYQSSLTCAREQQAKSWELRAASSLAQLWHGQRKFTEARDLLQPVYAWFTEGFDTHDLRAAKALLDALAVAGM